MIFNPIYYLFALPGLLLGIWAQMKLMAAFHKYNKVTIANGLSGAQAAREILDQNGLQAIPISEVPGQLTDHYDPTKRALFLSADNYHGRTIAAVGVAAHETGHALQHQAAYLPLQLRSALVPVTQFASFAAMGIFMLGFVFHLAIFAKLIGLALAAFAIVTLFQLVTLPVEYDASRRAKVELLRLGLVQGPEAQGVRQVLSAAALTYVAALVQAVMTLLYYLSLARSNRN